jgi:DNA-binding XRE family transcriptional regulator
MIEVVETDHINAITTHTCGHISKRTYTDKRLALRYDAKGALEVCPACKQTFHTQCKHQIRAARALLIMSREALCIKAGVALETLVRVEKGKKCDDGTLQTLRRALEASGVIFIDGDNYGITRRMVAEVATHPAAEATVRDQG